MIFISLFLKDFNSILLFYNSYIILYDLCISIHQSTLLYDSVGSWNEKSVYKYELFVFNIDEIELFVFIGVENEQFVFNGIENAHLLYPLNSPFRINIWGGGRNVHYRFYRKRGFLVPPAPPPIGSILQKIGKKSESTQNGLIRREIEKKIFAPWWPPP